MSLLEIKKWSSEITQKQIAKFSDPASSLISSVLEHKREVPKNSWKFY